MEEILNLCEIVAGDCLVEIVDDREYSFWVELSGVSCENDFDCKFPEMVYELYVEISGVSSVD